MNTYLAWLLTVLSWIVYPVYFVLYYVALGILAVLSPISRVLLFLLQPVVYLAQFIGTCVTAPFYFLQRFETLYIYLGVASLTGVAIALLLHYFYSFLHSSLHLASEPATRGPTAKQYRAARQRKAKQAYEPLLSPVPLGVSDIPGRGRRGLLAQTIHEEGDSDF
ncbi:hypothetical protein MBLNU459_g5385t1 [Dothideomycetes sp. NU459]